MPVGWRKMFAGGFGIGVVVLAATACTSFWSSRTPTSAAASPPEPALADVYNTARIEGEPMMRVRIGDGLSRTTIDGPERVTLTPPGMSPEVRVLTTPVTITHIGDHWSVASGGDVLKLPDAPEGEPWTVDLLTVRPLGTELLTLDDAPLPGDLAFHVEDNGRTFDAVEHVNIEAYLPGVIAKELYPNWSLETFKAQAIAARSYALHERARRRTLGSHYDVVSTTQDQAYAGATRHATAHEAVKATTGIVLTWSGEVLRAYYSSTVGGRAASAADTWPVGPGFEFNTAQPIQAHTRGDEDKISPRYRWTVERSVTDVSQRLRAFGKDRSNSIRNLGRVRSIRVKDRNAFNRPVRFEIEDDRGKTYTLRAEDLRVAFNFSADAIAKVTARTRVYSSDIDVTLSGSTVTVNGRGFGHGVGMSQFGAEALARAGWDASRILRYYYHGAELQRAY